MLWIFWVLSPKYHQVSSSIIKYLQSFVSKGDQTKPIHDFHSNQTRIKCFHSTFQTAIDRFWPILGTASGAHHVAIDQLFPQSNMWNVQMDEFFKHQQNCILVSAFNLLWNKHFLYQVARYARFGTLASRYSWCVNFRLNCCHPGPVYGGLSLCHPLEMLTWTITWLGQKSLALYQSLEHIEIVGSSQDITKTSPQPGHSMGQPLGRAQPRGPGA